MNPNIFSTDARNLAHLRYYESDTDRAILQNVEIIMTTPKGTVPLCLDFGVDQSFIDYPVSEARIRMIAPIRESIEEWEPRVRVISVKDTVNPLEPNRLSPTAEVTIADGT